MRHNQLQRYAVGASTTLVLLTLPTLALALFAPTALRGLGTTARVAPARPAPAPARLVPVAIDESLSYWQDTDYTSDAPYLMSVMNVSEINAIYNGLTGLPQGSPQRGAAQADLALTLASAFAFESNYKVISLAPTPYLQAGLVSALLHGELNSFASFARLPTTNPFAQAILAQRAGLLNQEVNALESWYFNATKNGLSAGTIQSQLNTFAHSFQATSQGFTAFQVQEMTQGQISGSTFTYTAPQF